MDFCTISSFLFFFFFFSPFLSTLLFANSQSFCRHLGVILVALVILVVVVNIIIIGSGDRVLRRSSEEMVVFGADGVYQVRASCAEHVPHSFVGNSDRAELVFHPSTAPILGSLRQDEASNFHGVQLHLASFKVPCCRATFASGTHDRKMALVTLQGYWCDRTLFWTACHQRTLVSAPSSTAAIALVSGHRQNKATKGQKEKVKGEV